MNSCYLCKSNEKDEVKYGEFMTNKKSKLSVHYFCLLLTSNLLQRGTDDEGFLGFLEEDIKLEAKRIQSAVCCYCKKKSANISCCAPRCHKSFHMVCGEINNAANKFVGTFVSFCDRHVAGKKIKGPSKDDNCCICYENIFGEYKKFNCVKMLQAPCCKNGWFHKLCLSAFAKTAGYFFKCPLCNDNNVFRTRLAHRGIFIPDRDAAWELEPNAYAELLERPTQCSATFCRIKENLQSKHKRIKLIYCATCGSVAIHRRCMDNPAQLFNCEECISLTQGKLGNGSVSNASYSESEDEDVDIDVCDDIQPGNLEENENITSPSKIEKTHKGDLEGRVSLDEGVVIINEKTHLNSVLPNNELVEDTHADKDPQLASGNVNKIFEDEETAGDNSQPNNSADLTKDYVQYSNNTFEDQSAVNNCIESYIMDFNIEHQSVEDADTIKPLGLAKHKQKNFNKIFNNEGLIEDCVDPIANNNLDSDEEENSIPLSLLKNKTKKNVQEDKIVYRNKSLKRPNRLISSESERSAIVNKRKRLNSMDTESLFDSGAESDRSASSEYNCNDKQPNQVMYMDDIVELTKNDKLKNEKRSEIRLVHVSDSPNVSILKSRKKRFQSMYADRNYNPNESEEFLSTDSIQKFKNISSTTLKLEIEILTENNTGMKYSVEDNTSEMDTLDNFSISKESENLSEKISRDWNMRLRQKIRYQDDSPTFERKIRRQSFLDSPYGIKPQHSFTRNRSSSVCLGSSTENNSRGESKVTIRNKKCMQNNSLSFKNENHYENCNVNYKKRSQRERSPLSANMQGISAFISSAHRNRQESQNSDNAKIVSRVPEPLLPKENNSFCRKNKLNIQHSETAPKIKNNGTTIGSVDEKKPTKKTFLNSLSLVTSTPAKPKAQKCKNKRNLLYFSNQLLPSNQTRIESFFKRL